MHHIMHSQSSWQAAGCAPGWSARTASPSGRARSRAPGAPFPQVPPCAWACLPGCAPACPLGGALQSAGYRLHSVVRTCKGIQCASHPSACGSTISRAWTQLHSEGYGGASQSACTMPECYSALSLLHNAASGVRGCSAAASELPTLATVSNGCCCRARTGDRHHPSFMVKTGQDSRAPTTDASGTCANA